jgi:acyl transferase domain-containing protein/acyl carrier protein
MNAATGNKDNRLTGLEIAVIGMAGRFPNAVDTRSFWENLKNGIEGIAFFSEDELSQEGYSSPLLENAPYVRAKGVMEGIEYFDAVFFDYSSREAELMDPQMRIFHELCWEAMEDAGYAPTVFKGLVGLYAGAAHNHHWIGLSAFSGKTRDLGQWASDQLVDKGYLTMRVSYKLNLKGPSYTMYTACSTSLAAVHLGCQAILNGECDMALTGGITITLPNKIAYLYQEGMILSPDGHCRAFDVEAGGTVAGNGAGVVLLKRLEDSLADNDHIYAVIKGSALNNDGFRKSGFTAPSVEGQVEAIRTAQKVAGVQPESISYIETHGTGTTIGDPIEVEALTIAFNTPKKNFCALGAVKSNIGHLDAAAGIAGFIKTVLALVHRQIPPSMHYNRPNPQIDFANSPFYVNTQLKEWKSETYPLRAGVSSFGIGGTNAHVILEESPRDHFSPAGSRKQGEGRKFSLVLLSAKKESTLQQITVNLVNYMKEKSTNPGQNLADIAYTLQVGREAFKYRKALTAADMEEAIQLLSDAADPSSPGTAQVREGSARDKTRPVFMFSGQGAQYVNMGRDIYETERVFREEMDRCFEILKPLMDCDIKEILYPRPGCRGGVQDPPGPGNSPLERGAPQGRGVSSDINQTQITQPLIFAFEYAMAKLLVQWGIEPYAMIGHSIGEYAAACLSGVFSLEDALKLVALRGKLMQQMPPGAMLSVTLPEEELMPILQQHPHLSLAAVNAPSLCVVSGQEQAVDAIENQLRQQGSQCRRLHTSHAFHSQMMDPMLKPYQQAVNQISLKKPCLPFISNLSARWISIEQAQSPAYWVEHVRQTVRFRDGLTPLLEDPHTIFIEMGPGRGLATFVQKHHRKKDEHIIINLVKHPKEDSPDNYYLVNKIGRLWLYGVAIDWQGFYADEQRQRVSLPTYPFERKLYQLEGDPRLFSGEVGVKTEATWLTDIKKKPDPAEWLYVPSWKRTPDPAPEPEPGNPEDWLIFTDRPDGENGTTGSYLLERLKQARPRDRFTRVETGTGFGTISPGNSDLIFTVNPRQENDYQALIAELEKQQRLPRRIIHLWNLSPGNTGKQEQEWAENYEMYEYRGFYSLIYLAKAIGGEGIGETIKIIVVTDNMQEVSGEETLCPPKAMVMGPVRVIPLETPNLHCRSIDVLLPPAGSRQEKTLVERLALEFMAETPDSVIAYRHHYRWVQSFEPLPPASSPTAAGEKVPLLKDGGVYLITGGLGGIGLELTRHLAKKVKAKFILLSRTALPQREEWQNWLDNHNYTDKTSSRIRKIRELEALAAGTEIMAASADVCDYQQVQTVIDRAEKKWGKINGVIHAAGIPGGGMVQLKTPGIAEKVLAPKVQGTLVLDKILTGHPLDFFVLFSSINSIVPMFGQVDYFSANAFLDAFSHYKNSQDTIVCLDINWDTWQGVGMAVEAAQQWRDRRGSGTGEIKHPLFDRCLYQDQKQAVFVTYFNFHRHWVLNEHKISASGKGLLPGVTYLEMARQALETYTGIKLESENRMIKISDVYFLNPLTAAEGEERETQFILQKQNENNDIFYDFLVRSRTGPGETGWQKHALGKICWQEKEQDTIHDIEKIAAGWEETLPNTSQPPHEEGNMETREGLLVFGPRWRSSRRIKLGEKQGLAFMELGAQFSRELEFYKLHPALLDSATGFLFSRVGQDAYIPFAYKQLTMKAPLTPKICSYNRAVETGETKQKETLKFDITITDETGKELVDIKEFTMLHVSEQVKEKVKGKETAPLNLDVKVKAEDRQKDQFLENGIQPSEGMEVFDRLLSGASTVPRALSQVVVSTTDLLTRLRRSGLTPMALKEKPAADDRTPAPAQAPLTLHERPEISSVYVSPKTETEKKIAEVWQRLLGIKQVGINDDFFELGGDSLNVVQLNNELKKLLDKDIPVAVMFRHQTIRAFTQYLQQEGMEEEVLQEKKERSSDIAESRDRLKVKMKKRETRRNNNEGQ